MRTEGRTDRQKVMMKLILASRNFCERAKIGPIFTNIFLEAMGAICSNGPLMR